MPAEAANGKPPDPVVEEILDAFNEVTDRRLKHTPLRRSKVRQRLRNGFTPEQLKRVAYRARDDPFYNGAEGERRGPETMYKNRERVEAHLEWLEDHEPKARPELDHLG